MDIVEDLIWEDSLLEVLLVERKIVRGS